MKGDFLRTLQLQEAEDILYGACIYGTGGGGSLSEGLEIIKNIYRNGKEIKLIALEDVKDHWLVASPYYVGSVAPPSDEIVQKLKGLKPVKENVSTIATRILQKNLREEIKCICATELGGNTAWAMEVAASLDIPLVDADPAGRAVPDLAQTTFNIFDVSIAPFALANRYGDTLVVETAASHDRAEAIARTFATISGNYSGICDHPVKGEKFRTSVIEGTISKAQAVGRAMRLANEDGVNPIETITLAGDGKILFKGTVSEASWEDVGGFIEGIINIKSDNLKNEMSVWFRNENMTARIADKIVSIIPELIIILDYQTGKPLLNPSCKAGMEVAVLSFPAPTIWETDKGLSIFGPEYIGMEKKDYLNLKIINGMGK